MLSTYAEGRDLHTLTAQNLTSQKGVSKEDRMLAKAVNFGLLYGMGANGLQSYALKSYGVEMSLEQAALYRKRFFESGGPGTITPYPFYELVHIRFYVRG